MNVEAGKIAILWGSETGTAEELAERTKARLKEAGHEAELLDMSDVNCEKLAGYGTALVLTSTWGDGDPPSNAIDLWGELQMGKTALPNLSYSVCALGDTAYPQFCKCGHDFDEYMENLGATRIYALQECDIDYEEPFEAWLNGVLGVLQARETADV